MKILHWLKFWLWFQTPVVVLPGKPLDLPVAMVQSDAVRRIRLRCHFNKPMGWNKHTAFEKERLADTYVKEIKSHVDHLLNKASLLALNNAELAQLRSVAVGLVNKIDEEVKVR